MDSLSVHKSEAARKAYDKLDIEPLFAPIYSPDYNPIEMMFSKLKALVKRLRLQDMVKMRQRRFDELLPIVVKELKVEEIDSCIDHVMDLYEEKSY